MSKKHHVLVVEDDELGFQLVKQILRKMPLEFTHASNGAAAIACLEQEIPELILLDLTLPDMRGWDVLDRFKNDARLQKSHVIVLTGHDNPVHRLIGSLKEIAVYMNKPFKAEDLRQQVRTLLNLDA